MHHKAMLDEIYAGVPAEHLDWLKDQLSHSNDLVLSQRIEFVLNVRPNVAARIVGPDDALLTLKKRGDDAPETARRDDRPVGSDHALFAQRGIRRAALRRDRRLLPGEVTGSGASTSLLLRELARAVAFGVAESLRAADPAGRDITNQARLDSRSRYDRRSAVRGIE